MSFNAIEKRGFRCTAEGIAISIVRDKARSAPLMLIRLAPDVMAAAGLNRADRVEVALGALRDDGLLRLASNPKGWAICRSSKALRLGVDRWRALDAAIAPRRHSMLLRLVVWIARREEKGAGS